jgi:hypothetical protein
MSIRLLSADLAAAARLDVAALLIRRDGWMQGDLYDRSGAEPPESSCKCLLGAVLQACFGSPDPDGAVMSWSGIDALPEVRFLAAYLREMFGAVDDGDHALAVTEANDTMFSCAEEAVAVLHAAAKRARGGEVEQ